MKRGFQELLRKAQPVFKVTYEEPGMGGTTPTRATSSAPEDKASAKGQTVMFPRVSMLFQHQIASRKAAHREGEGLFATVPTLVHLTETTLQNA